MTDASCKCYRKFIHGIKIRTIDNLNDFIKRFNPEKSVNVMHAKCGPSYIQ